MQRSARAFKRIFICKMWLRYSREQALQSSKVRALGNLNWNFEISNLLFAVQVALRSRRRFKRAQRTQRAQRALRAMRCLRTLRSVGLHAAHRDSTSRHRRLWCRTRSRRSPNWSGCWTRTRSLRTSMRSARRSSCSGCRITILQISILRRREGRRGRIGESRCECT